MPDLDFMFHMFFLARYCKLLEENSFRGRTADFFYMLLFGATVLTGIVLIGGMIPYVSVSFAKLIFLSNSLTFMMVSVPQFTCETCLIGDLFCATTVSEGLRPCFFLQVYVWSKQNPFIHMSFLGLFTFTASYLPWVSHLNVLLPWSCWSNNPTEIHLRFVLLTAFMSMKVAPFRSPTFYGFISFCVSLLLIATFLQRVTTMILLK